MRISELIEKLKSLKETKGDVKVFVPTHHGSTEAKDAFFIAPSLVEDCDEERVLIHHTKKDW